MGPRSPGAECRRHRAAAWRPRRRGGSHPDWRRAGLGGGPCPPPGSQPPVWSAAPGWCPGGDPRASTGQPGREGRADGQGQMTGVSSIKPQTFPPSPPHTRSTARAMRTCGHAHMHTCRTDREPGGGRAGRSCEGGPGTHASGELDPLWMELHPRARYSAEPQSKEHPHTSGTPIFRQASKKLSTFFRDLRALSFG